MTTEQTVLDHGYIRLVTHWGSDQAIIEAARMSTGKGFLGWGPKCRSCGDGEGSERDCPAPNGHLPLIDCGRGGHFFDHPGDEKLLAFLWKNNHATPFEFGGAVVEVQAPIFVFREWHRHRSQSYNEASARYAPLPDMNYVPSVERLMIGTSGTNKQAGTIAGANVLTESRARTFQDVIQLHYEELERTYQLALREGVPKELARVILPVGRYSRMRASANLRNWLAFLTLREAPNAQWEIRQYAHALHKILAPLFPRTMQLFEEVKR